LPAAAKEREPVGGVPPGMRYGARIHADIGEEMIGKFLDILRQGGARDNMPPEADQGLVQALQMEGGAGFETMDRHSIILHDGFMPTFMFLTGNRNNRLI
jgi:hypothetical protein